MSYTSTSYQEYISWNIALLYAAFVQLKAAFDSISQTKLWNKLYNTTIDCCCFLFVHCMKKQSLKKDLPLKDTWQHLIQVSKE